MPSSSGRWTAGLAVFLLASSARAQQKVQGFNVDRFYPSPAGAGWLVMDDLKLYGGLGGAMGLAFGYGHAPLRIVDGAQRVFVVTDEVSAYFGAAITYDRWRFYLNIDMPFVIVGDSGTVGTFAFTAPNVTPGSLPDPMSDLRLGTDFRIVGDPESSFRFGVSGQVYLPSTTRADYDTDGTFRGMVRALFAGDVRDFAYAAQLGLHIRPLDDSPAPESPQGSEWLFGAAIGPKIAVGRARSWTFILGPEIYCATAFRALFGSSSTALEGLLSGRLERTTTGGPDLRIRLGAGAGIHPQFGAPEWRVLAGIEMSGRAPAATLQKN
jgi:hypothetical protein